MSDNFQKRLKAAALLLFVTSVFINPSEAKNGVFPHGIGNQFGTGGAGTALAVGATDLDGNPAAGSRLDTQLSAYFINFFQKQSLDTSNARAGNQ